MFQLGKEEQLKRLSEFEERFKAQGLSLAEGRRLAANLYVSGGLYPELLAIFDDFMLKELEKRNPNFQAGGISF